MRKHVQDNEETIIQKKTLKYVKDILDFQIVNILQWPKTKQSNPLPVAAHIEEKE